MNGELSRAAVDRLGERLRKGVSAEDLELLDRYRREFRYAYEHVVAQLKPALVTEVSGRPAKSTAAILEKLARSSMRLTQMQDIAGCRLLVAGRAEQDVLVARIAALMEAEVFDRRETPSHGYRAVHLVVQVQGKPVEIQVRTELQHLWAALSEKMADQFGNAVKYGGGPQDVRNMLIQLSDLVADSETWEVTRPTDAQFGAFRRKLKLVLQDAMSLSQEAP